jgi:hypothetical protein
MKYGPTISLKTKGQKRPYLLSHDIHENKRLMLILLSPVVIYWWLELLGQKKSRVESRR